MKRVIANERGMALALAIVALVVVGALVAGAFFAGTQEQRVGENARFSQQAFGVAEEGAYEVIRMWKSDSFNTLDSFPVGDQVAPSHTGRFAGMVRRLNSEIYFIDITGRDSTSLAAGAAFRRRGGGAAQRIGLLARIRPLQIDVKAAVTSGGQNVIAGNASIDGTDHIPAGWANCGTLDSAKAGVRMQDDATMSLSGHPTLVGTPPVLKDPTLADSSFSKYGDVTYAALIQRATINLPAQNFSNGIGPTTNADGTCNKANQQNWGDPLNPNGPCGKYFPIIHIYGDGAVINGQVGQGILLVDGGLSVQGGFQFFGVVIIKGSLKTSGGGGNPAHFWGTVMAQDTVAFSDTTNNITGNANLLYSKCAILRALDNTGVVAMMRSRGWVQLF